LGYKNSRSAVAKHCFNAQKMTVPKRYGQNGGAQFKTIINESDLYRIISHSHLPAAKDFECWIMEKVIPSIRKTGSYTMPASGKPMSHLKNISPRTALGHVHGAHGEIIPFDFGKLTLTTIVDGDGNPWWISKEVCDYLGYVNSRDAVATHCFKVQKMTVPKRYGQRGGAHSQTIINEPDLYRIISHSQLPADKIRIV
jgi:prophage antirepressor-like protein